MNDLIRINYEGEQPIVSARDLYDLLSQEDGVKGTERFWQEAKLNYVPSLNTLHQPFDAIKDKVFLVK